MFKENFINLCNQKNVAPTVVLKEIGLTPATFSKWDDTSVPRKATLYKLADYFGVTVDSLLAEDPVQISSPELSELDSQNVHMIPLFENASAGFGALAVNEIVDYVPLHFQNPVEANETICIKVKGNSMAPMIASGDVIQVHKQETVDNGSIAVVLVDGDEGLVKIVTCGEGWIELRSANSLYKPMRFNGRDVLRVRVVGLVKKIIKNVSGKHETIYPPTQSENKKNLLQMIDSFDDDQLKELESYMDFLASKKR